MGPQKAELAQMEAKYEASNPTAATESVLLTGAIEEKEERDVVTLDISNAFLQTSLPIDEAVEERVIMKLRAVLMNKTCSYSCALCTCVTKAMITLFVLCLSSHCYFVLK